MMVLITESHLILLAWIRYCMALCLRDLDGRDVTVFKESTSLLLSLGRLRKLTGFK